MVNPNIFKPRNDWNVKTNRCRKYAANITPYSETIDKLIKIRAEVLDKTKISKKLFISSSKKRRLVEARQMYFYRARIMTKATLEEIGSLVLNGSHSNVLQGIRKVNIVPELISKYDELFNGVEPITIVKVTRRKKQIKENKIYLPQFGVPTYKN